MKQPSTALKPRHARRSLRWVRRLGMLTLLLHAFTAYAAPSPDAHANPIMVANDLESFVDDIMADHFDRFELAGAAVTVVKDGDVILSKGYGYADIAAGIPVEPDSTIFSTASVAKLYTWTAVMQLVERGELDLDAEVNSYLTAFQIPDTFEEPVRVWHLLSHTAGFEDTPVVGLMARSAADVPDLETALVRWMPKRVWPPGLTISYNNYSAALAAQLVAEVTGQSWEDYLETSILQPLGMTRSSLRQPFPADFGADLAKSYHNGADGLYETAFEYVTIAPSGGTVSTTEDMARFMIAHLQHGRYGDTRILEEATARRMHTQLFTHDPRLPGNAHGFWEGFANGERFLYHGGDTSSYTLLVLVPEHDLGFYVAYNSPGGSLARREFQRAFLDHAFPPGAAPAPVQVAGNPGAFDGLTGTYGDTRLSVTTIAKLMGLLGSVMVSSDDGLLMTDIPGYGQQRWVEEEPLAFAEVGGTEQLVFRTDERGRASHVFFSDLPEFAFAATAWYDRLELHGALLGIWLLALLTSLVAWPFYGRARPVTGAKSAAWTRIARRLPAVTSLLYLLFIVILVLALLNFTEIEFGVTPLLAGGLILALFASVLTLGSVLFAIFAWRRRSWSMVERLHYSFVALACVSLTWQLHHWNLLGFRV
jgi:CubicO group peptidase (beta-lactamase class C family)